MITINRENRNNERVIATTTSSMTSIEKLETKVKGMLDALSEHVTLPYGWVLEGRVTDDSFNNWSLYVFIRHGKDVYPGIRSGSNPLPQIEEVAGGKWISLNEKHWNYHFDAAWEARDIQAAYLEILEQRNAQTDEIMDLLNPTWGNPVTSNKIIDALDADAAALKKATGAKEVTVKHETRLADGTLRTDGEGKA